MVRFTMHGEVDENGHFVYSTEVADGETVNRGEVARCLALWLVWATEALGTRIHTVSEAKALDAARRIPDGWEATTDGVTTVMNATNGGSTFTKTWRRAADGAVADVPCAGNGEPIPVTRDALLAYDAAHPLPPSPEA